MQKTLVKTAGFKTQEDAALSQFCADPLITLCLRFRKYCIRESHIAYLYLIYLCKVSLELIKILGSLHLLRAEKENRGVKIYRLFLPVMVSAAITESTVTKAMSPIGVSAGTGIGSISSGQLSNGVLSTLPASPCMV